MLRIILRKSSLVNLSIITIIVLTGCSSINQEPFNQFSDAVKKTSTATETATALSGKYAKEDFTNNFIATNAKLSSLEIKVKENNDGTLSWQWEMPEFQNANFNQLPPFIQIQRSITALKTLNASFCQYTELLKILSSPTLISDDKLKALQDQINATAATAWKLKNNNSSSAAPKLISSATADIIKLFLKNKQKRFLKRAIKNNQKNVKAYAKLGTDLLAIIYPSVIKYYKNSYTKLNTEWQNNPDKSKTLNAMLDLNDKFINMTTTFEALESAYKALPKANAELAKSVGNSEIYCYELQKLYDISQLLVITNTNEKKQEN